MTIEMTIEVICKQIKATTTDNLLLSQRERSKKINSKQREAWHLQSIKHFTTLPASEPRY